MIARALRIWLMHSLAFLAGLVVAWVVAEGLRFLLPTDSGYALFVGAAVAVSILSVGAGYGVYLSLLPALLDVVPGWGFYLGGPLLVLAVMLLVFMGVYLHLMPAGLGTMSGYGLLYLVGWGTVHWRVGKGEAANTDPDRDPEDAP